MCYDLTNEIIGALPLYKIRESYLVERKYRPSERLIEALQKYYEDKEYKEVIAFKEEKC